MICRIFPSVPASPSFFFFQGRRTGCIRNKVLQGMLETYWPASGSLNIHLLKKVASSKRILNNLWSSVLSQCFYPIQITNFLFRISPHSVAFKIAEIFVQQLFALPSCRPCLLQIECLLNSWNIILNKLRKLGVPSISSTKTIHLRNYR